MKVKIFYRSTTIWNIILFILLSYMFVYISQAIYSSNSIFEKSFLISFSRAHIWLIALYSLTLISVFKISSKSKPMFFLSVAGTIGVIGFFLFKDFSKLITLILFFYTIVAYYLYKFLDIELNESFYNPMYKKDDLFDPMLLKFNCIIEGKEFSKKAFLTNWNEAGFFIFFTEELTTKVPKSSQAIIYFEGQKFKCDVKLVSKAEDTKGYGFRILKENSNEDLSWFGFYQIIDKMGYQVEYLK